MKSTGASNRLGELGELYRTHHSRVLRTAYRITGDTADAEDVLQTVFLRLLRRDGGWEEVLDSQNYLCRAAINAALDLLRARRSRQDAPVEVAEKELPSGDDSAQWDQAEMSRRLREAVTRLHPTAAEMFSLRYFEGYDNGEVAAMMGTTQSVVAVTLHRARARLQQELQISAGGGR